MINIGYGLALRRERRGLRRVWNGYRDGVSLGWSYRHYADAAMHMGTLVRFEATVKRMGL